MLPLILTSGSINRAKQLKSFSLEFSVVNSTVEESKLSGERPKSMALRLAKLKELALATKNLNTLVVGADQVVVVDGVALRKPGNFDRAVAQLKTKSGRKIIYYTT